jgi:hypothetical protein
MALFYLTPGKRQYNPGGMSSSFLLILVLVFSIGALLAAWAGIRSIQSARTVVFYRTRQARMLAGWQWLGFSMALGLFAVVSMTFGNSLLDRILSPASVPTTLPDVTLTPIIISSQTNTGTLIPTLTQSVSVTETPETLFTVTVAATPSRTPSYLGTYTALAIWTERRSTFIAMLSFTPTASRTPIPTWTRTPSSTPRPTYTASPTRTPRPTITLIPTHTLPPTWTASPTRTPRPTLTPTSTQTRTLTPTP